MMFLELEEVYGLVEQYSRVRHEYHDVCQGLRQRLVQVLDCKRRRLQESEFGKHKAVNFLKFRLFWKKGEC